MQHTISKVAQTPKNRNVYAWGIGAELLSGNVQKILNELDGNAEITSGGCFLITHQRDTGYIFWYSQETLPASQSAWISNGKIIDTFDC